MFAGTVWPRFVALEINLDEAGCSLRGRSTKVQKATIKKSVSQSVCRIGPPSVFLGVSSLFKTCCQHLIDGCCKLRIACTVPFQPLWSSPPPFAFPFASATRQTFRNLSDPYFTVVWVVLAFLLFAELQQATEKGRKHCFRRKNCSKRKRKAGTLLSEWMLGRQKLIILSG